MSFLLLVFVLSALAFQVFPVALGSSIKQNASASLKLITALVLTQTLMLWLATLVGQRFLYLTEEYRNTIVFIGFFLVGMRIAMESFAVRKGERTFNADNNQNIVLASLAQSINTFLAGLMFYFFDFSQLSLVTIFFALTLLISLLGSVVNLNKQSLAFTSLVYLVGGLGLIITSIYIGFF